MLESWRHRAQAHKPILGAAAIEKFGRSACWDGQEQDAPIPYFLVKFGSIYRRPNRLLVQPVGSINPPMYQNDTGTRFDTSQYGLPQNV